MRRDHLEIIIVDIWADVASLAPHATNFHVHLSTVGAPYCTLPLTVHKYGTLETRILIYKRLYEILIPSLSITLLCQVHLAVLIDTIRSATFTLQRLSSIPVFHRSRKWFSSGLAVAVNGAKSLLHGVGVFSFFFLQLITYFGVDFFFVSFFSYFYWFYYVGFFFFFINLFSSYFGINVSAILCVFYVVIIYAVELTCL